MLSYFLPEALPLILFVVLWNVVLKELEKTDLWGEVLKIKDKIC